MTFENLILKKNYLEAEILELFAGWNRWTVNHFADVPASIFPLRSKFCSNFLQVVTVSLGSTLCSP